MGNQRVLLFFLVLSFRLSAQDLKDSAAIRTKQFLASHSEGYRELGAASEQIGHRLTGSEGGALAEKWIFDHLKSRGIQNVEFDPFSFRAWRRKSCRLEVVPYKSDNYMRIEAVSLANTNSADGIWHLVDGGDGLEKDLLAIASSIKGKCLILNLGLVRTDSGRKNLHRAEKVALALRFGASGVLFVHPKESDIVLTGTASLTGEQIPIPALCVSGQDGKLIRDWMRSERLMAEMKVVNSISEGTARNVVATIEAPFPTKETVVFCAHLDSWDLATGAIDNGIGAFTLLDVAAAVEREKQQLKRNVVFLWTMGEEQGLLGSRHFVEDLKTKKQLSSVRAVVNLDMVGNPVGMNDFAWPGASGWWEKTVKELTIHVPSFKGMLVHEPDLHSDHQPFMLEGIPVATAQPGLPDSLYDCYHANCDLFPLVREEDMKSSALIHSLLAITLGSTNKLPFSAMKERKLLKWLENHGLKEKLEISKEWKWK